MVDAGPEHLEVGPCEPTLESLRDVVFSAGCDWEYCHGRQTPAVGLWLLAPDLEARLVNHRAGICQGWELVVPGSPERSLLWQKVASDTPPCRTDRMPVGLPPLPPHALECLREWIEGLGADGGT